MTFCIARISRYGSPLSRVSVHPKTGHTADEKRIGSQAADPMTRGRRLALHSKTQGALEVTRDVGDIRRNADCHHTAQPFLDFKVLGTFSRRQV
jgi:hypothetical protein